MVKSRRNPIALAREWEALLADGTFASRADLARELGVSRARVTQVLNLLNLAPAVLEVISALSDPLPGRGIAEHTLRRVLKLGWHEQKQVLSRLPLGGAPVRAATASTRKGIQKSGVNS
jgi:ParB-like chromosome segregation protein Spo0J